MNSVKRYFFRCLVFSFLMVLSLCCPVDAALAQKAFAIKKWKGEYPDMKGSYPFTFLAFKGKIIPVPYLFVRIYPSHYYYGLTSMPVTDATVITGEVKTGLLRIAARLLEQNFMEGRRDKTAATRNFQEIQRAINLEIFQSRGDSLQDFFSLSYRFVEIYAALARLVSLENSAAIGQMLEREADALLARFLMVNLLETDHGKKLQEFALLKREIENLLGEIDYTRQKMTYYTYAGKVESNSYFFLAQ
jgi:hypothetical protein